MLHHQQEAKTVQTHSKTPKIDNKSAYGPDHARAALCWFSKVSQEEWRLSVDEQCALLGDLSKRTYHKWKKAALSKEPVSVNRDVMERLSLLLGIYKGLSIIAPTNQVKDGVKKFIEPNLNPVFEGMSMKDYAVSKGSLGALYMIRRYLDRARG